MTSETSKEEDNKTNQLSEGDKIRALYERLPEEVKNMGIYRVVLTPGRKPRKRDYDKCFFTVFADNLEEAKLEAKKQIESMGLPYKEKWFSIHKDSLKALVKTKSFKDFYDKHKDDPRLLEDDDDDNITGKLEKLTRDDKEPIQLAVEVEVDKKDIKNKGNYELARLDLSMELDTEKVGKYYSKITPKNISIVDMPHLKDFKIIPVKNDGTYPEIIIRAKTIGTALNYFITCVKNDNYFDLYSDIKSFTAINPDDKELITIELGNIREANEDDAN